MSMLMFCFTDISVSENVEMFSKLGPRLLAITERGKKFQYCFSPGHCQVFVNTQSQGFCPVCFFYLWVASFLYISEIS